MTSEILIVENNQDSMALMDYLLKAGGYTSVLATSAAEGIRLAREERPDLILMALHMPDMDGYEANAAIKGDPELMRCTVLAVTTSAMLGDEKRIIDSGFDGYLSKPITPDTFVSQVEAFLPEKLRANDQP